MSFTPHVPALGGFDWIVVNSSSGKDSQVMLDEVVRLCREQGVNTGKIVVVHADLGRVEHNPRLLDEYIAVEERIGHLFRDGWSIAQVKGRAVTGPVEFSKCL